MSYTLTDIAKHIGATVKGDGNITVSSLATLAAAKNHQIAFLANSKYQSQLKDTQAGAVIISEDMLDSCPTNALVMANPYMGYAMTAQLLDSTPAPAADIHPRAVIDDTVSLGEGVAIGANAVIESGVVLGDNVVVGAGCFVGKDTVIGEGTRLWANVTVYHNIEIGKHCLVQANTVIGSDGFGYAPHQGQWHKIPQLGRVIIGDRVEIGASTTIDRGALGDTIIGSGCILDNQLQIAHNVEIGENTAMAACSVIAGSTKIGKNCTIAGLVGVNGHIEVADNVVLTGMTMVTKAITKPGVYSSGMPSQPNKDWHRMNARLRKIDETTKKVAQLEKVVAEAKKER
ncbi:MAG: UDP-3-O-(3-hydroxymyristoyl)glucosamine N-acyltransferase [Colwelliaceae bacterium]|nr:UDP-3-O-(3-hydroxymyristoyl)glucosamine N-acyltransferase [Colwelliaceae bacterium]